MDKAYSTNGEEFRHTDICDVLQELADDDRMVEGALYYEIDCEHVRMDRYLRADRILEQAGEQIWGEVGDAADDAFEVSSGAEAELDALLKAWADKHITTRYWRCIGKARELRVTAADVAEYAEPAP